jgi:hypothetical protein
MTHLTKKCGSLALALAVTCAAWLPAAREARADELKDGKAALQAGQLDDAMRLF